MSDGTFARTLLLNVYGFAWTLARPVLRRNKRLREGFSWRLVPEDWAGLPTDSSIEGLESEKRERLDVWIQAASGGEAYLVWELLKRLPEAVAAVSAENVAGDPVRSTKPLRVLVTTWTRQGLEVLHGMAATLGREYPELSIHVAFFPLDAPGIMARALDQARPRVVALLETELWPGLMAGCAKRNIPVLVLNGRMTEKSLRGYQLLNVCTRGFWKSVAPVRVTAISLKDAARFAELFGAERVEVVPNIKFDRAVPVALTTSPIASEQSVERFTSQATNPLLTFLPPALHHGHTVLLASVREEEEEAIVSTIRFLRERSPVPTIIVAPRHMHRVDAWRKKLDKAKLTALFRSEWKSEWKLEAEIEGSLDLAQSSTRSIPPVPAGSIVIWDSFGELNNLYMLADAVFVGGSLAPLGGQNFLEPLALGKIPCCGPHLKNFAWALVPSGKRSTGEPDSLDVLGLLHRCRTAKSLAHALQNALEKPVAPAEVRRRFSDWLTPRLGGALRCAVRLAELGR